MKKQILILVMLIIGLTAISNLTACKKKDSDPSANSGCGIVAYEVFLPSGTGYTFVYGKNSSSVRDTITYVNGTFTTLNPNSNNCNNSGYTLYVHIWNTDSSRVYYNPNLYCPPNDTIVINY